jgi:molecular chaperone HtpG
MSRDVEHIHLEVDVNRIIEVLASQIYQTPLALLRENAQNAFDAILMRRHRSPNFEPKIQVTVTDTEISISDNGIGMSPEDLRNHYWHAGSSGKNNKEARAAGVVGTFGIGAMANFGIADSLELETESMATGERTRTSAKRQTLSATEDCIDIVPLESTGSPGTTVRALMPPDSIDVEEAISYIGDFVRLVEIPVYVNDQLVSQQGIEAQVPPPREAEDIDAGRLEGRLSGEVRLRVTNAGEVWAHVSDLTFGQLPVKGEIAMRQGESAIRTFRSGFGLAVTSATSAYSFGGAANIEIFEPTAGREALTTQSMQLLQEAVTDLDRVASQALSKLPQANQSTALMAWALNYDRVDFCGRLEARVEPGPRHVPLQDLRDHARLPVVYFAGSDPAIIREVASDDSPLVVLAANNPRRKVEQTYLLSYCEGEKLKDKPSALREKPRSDWSLAEQAVVFRVASILASDYFLTADVTLGKLSHNLPAMVETESVPPKLYLDPRGNTFTVVAALYNEDYDVFGSMVKDFVRNVVFPKVSELVPSSTREGAEAFLKSIRRTREVFEYEANDLESLGAIWGDFIEGKISIGEATRRSVGAARQGIQVISSRATRNASDVVPDLETMRRFQVPVEPGPVPPILRSDAATEAKLLVLDPDQGGIQGYRCFVALSERVVRDRGEFFLQPHATSIVWGGQKVLFVFEHHSGEFGLYYDLQANDVVAPESGGGPFPTATLVLRDQIFIPVPDPLAKMFIPEGEERKRFEVRSDLLYTDAQRVPASQVDGQ